MTVLAHTATFEHWALALLIGAGVGGLVVSILAASVVGLAVRVLLKRLP